MENTTRLGEDNCPACKKKLDSASPPGDEKINPNPGDISVCIGCGAILTFNPDMSLRLMTNRELEDLDHDTFDKVWNLSMTILTHKK